jgi:hypothetical protein
MFDLGEARTRVPVRMAKVFIERMKAEESFMRMAVVVDIAVVGDGFVVLVGLMLELGVMVVVGYFRFGN